MFHVGSLGLVVDVRGSFDRGSDRQDGSTSGGNVRRIEKISVHIAPPCSLIEARE